MRKLLAAIVATTATALGCSSSNGAPPAAADAGDGGALLPEAGPPPDASAVDSPEEEAAPPVPYPAPHAKMPLVTFHGGHVIDTPAIVTITFQGDPYAPTFQSFGDTITNTPWWDAVRAGYCEEPKGSPCIERGASAGHVVMPAIGPTTWQAADVDAWVQQNVQNGTWPAPQPGILYTAYLPDGVSVSMGQGFDGCQAFDGYHAFTDVAVADAGAVTVPYAIMLRCHETIDQQTLGMSHEIIEASTDPFGDGWFTDDLAWSTFFYPEVGDLCDYSGQTSESGFVVQRIWSNLAAKAGHDPCVPAPAGDVYFGAAPIAASMNVPVGKTSKPLEVQAFSDAPTSDWTLEAVDLDGLYGGPPTLQIDLDRTTANNGTIAHATVTMLRAPPASRGFGVFAIISRRGSELHAWPLVVDE